MIVVDTNILAYAVLPGNLTESVLAVAERDPEWRAPRLWRSELRNVMVTSLRADHLDLPAALAAFSAASELVRDSDIEATPHACIELAWKNSISAYDAEFILTAQQLNLPLITADRRLQKTFPEVAFSPEQFIARL